MSSADELLDAAFRSLQPKPPDTASRAAKKRYSELLSNAIAQALAEELRRRGMSEARPSPPGEAGVSGAERRMAGGIGAKKVDVTWATQESGLLLGISVKTISFRDRRSGNFQKNLVNRRGDMLVEAVTLHRRFPYAVLIGMLFLDREASTDDSKQRNSTFYNAHQRYALFTGRDDPAGRDEQYERLYLALLEANPFAPNVEFYEAGERDWRKPLSDIFDEIIKAVVERNPDFYEQVDGVLRPVRGGASGD